MAQEAIRKLLSAALIGAFMGVAGDAYASGFGSYSAITGPATASAATKPIKASSKETGSDTEDAGEFHVSDDILAIEGDLEYGEYLSSECTTCHQADGKNDGIPSIVGWDPQSFVVVMHAYREKQLDHPAMQMIAGRLNNEEIAALAAYFERLGD